MTHTSTERLELLKEVRNLAMEWTSRGRIPECSQFAHIAQDLDYILATAPKPPETEAVQMPSPAECNIMDCQAGH